MREHDREDPPDLPTRLVEAAQETARAQELYDEVHALACRLRGHLPSYALACRLRKTLGRRLDRAVAHLAQLEHDFGTAAPAAWRVTS